MGPRFLQKIFRKNSLFGPVGGDEILWFDDFSVARGLTLFGGHGFTSSASPASQGLVEELTSEGLSWEGCLGYEGGQVHHGQGNQELSELKKGHNWVYKWRTDSGKIIGINEIPIRELIIKWIIKNKIKKKTDK